MGENKNTRPRVPKRFDSISRIEPATGKSVRLGEAQRTQQIGLNWLNGYDGFASAWACPPQTGRLTHPYD